MFTMTIRHDKGTTTLAPRNSQDVSALCETSNPFYRAWVELALIILYARQDIEERKAGQSTLLNGIGFDKFTAPFGTYFAEYVADGLTQGKELGSILSTTKKLGKRNRTVIEEATSIVVRHRGQVYDVLASVGDVSDLMRVLKPLLPEMAKRSRIANAKYDKQRIASK